jgi:hypothetical protein
MFRLLVVFPALATVCFAVVGVNLFSPSCRLIQLLLQCCGSGGWIGTILLDPGWIGNILPNPVGLGSTSFCRISIILPDRGGWETFSWIWLDRHHFAGSGQIGVILPDQHYCVGSGGFGIILPYPVISALYCRILSDRHHFPTYVELGIVSGPASN